MTVNEAGEFLKAHSDRDFTISAQPVYADPALREPSQARAGVSAKSHNIALNTFSWQDTPRVEQEAILLHEVGHIHTYRGTDEEWVQDEIFAHGWAILHAISNQRWDWANYLLRLIKVWLEPPQSYHYAAGVHFMSLLHKETTNG